MAGSVVKATEEAIGAAQELSTAISDGLEAYVSRLRGPAEILKSPEQWEGGNASKFRGEVWPDVETTLRNIETQMLDLQKQVRDAVQQILDAG